MKNYYPISDIGKHLTRAGENISCYAMCFAGTDKDQNPDLYAAYESILLNELENIQHLVMSLTQLVMDIAAEDEDREDGSAFFSQELNYNLGDKTQETEEEDAVDYVDPDEEEEEGD